MANPSPPQTSSLFFTLPSELFNTIYELAITSHISHEALDIELLSLK